MLRNMVGQLSLCLPRVGFFFYEWGCVYFVFHVFCPADHEKRV